MTESPPSEHVLPMALARWDRDIARRVLDTHDYLLEALSSDNRWRVDGAQRLPDPEAVLRASVNIVLRNTRE